MGPIAISQFIFHLVEFTRELLNNKQSPQIKQDNEKPFDYFDRLSPFMKEIIGFERELQLVMNKRMNQKNITDTGFFSKPKVVQNIENSENRTQNKI